MAEPRSRRATPAGPVPARHSAQVVWDQARGHVRAWSPELNALATGSSPEEALQELEIRAARDCDQRHPTPARTMESFSGRLRVRLSRSLHAGVAAAADDDGVSVNTFLLWLLEGKTGPRRPRRQGKVVAEGPSSAPPRPPYSAVVRWSESLEVFVATAPEIPDLDDVGALSCRGATRAAALGALRDMIPVVLRLRRTQGLPLPRPRVLPASPGQLLLRLPPRLHRALSEAADADGVSMNTHIESLVARGMGRRDERTRRS